MSLSNGKSFDLDRACYVIIAGYDGTFVLSYGVFIDAFIVDVLVDDYIYQVCDAYLCVLIVTLQAIPSLIRYYVIVFAYGYLLLHHLYYLFSWNLLYACLECLLYRLR
jgi:hypothetical protein